MIGRSVGHYSVLSKLGEGGMGEVYLARDERLGRDVALKVLPAPVANDRERLARFEREAKLLAALHHPNIALLYALEQIDRQHVLVMELAPGDDLSVRIDLGPLPLEDVLAIGSGIALALEAAHEHGIVHRDLKPANIKVGPDRGVKVLDFGLAKALGPDDPSSASAMNSPTLTAQATAAGVILGTAAYMSPEQARGRAADKRADIWSFGVVMFEMVSGERLFKEETVSDTLAAVLRQDIDWRRLPPGTPAELTRLLRRCLERDRRNRLHDIADARIVLDELARGGAEPLATVPAAPAQSSRWRWLIAAGLALALGLGALAGWLLKPPASHADSALTVKLTIPSIPGADVVGHPAMSPDGTFAVFEVYHGAQSELYVQRFDEAAPKRLERTEGAAEPFVSADARWIGFRRQSRIEKISIDGGDPLLVTDGIAPGPGSVWEPDGAIIVPANWVSGLVEIPAAGGAPRQLTKPDPARGERSHWYPSRLPDGQHILFTVIKAGAGLNDANIAVLDRRTGTYQMLLPGAVASFVSPGYLVFFRAGSYQAVKFDPRTHTVSGEPVRVMDDVRGMLPDGDDPLHSTEATSAAVYRVGPRIVDSSLAWISTGGKIDLLPFAARAYTDLSLSQDGRRAALGQLEGGRYVVRVLDFDRRTDEVLDLPGSNWHPVWHPDGHHLAIRTIRKGEYDAYLTDLSSTAPPTPLLVTDRDDSPVTWMPDGKSVLVMQSTPEGQYPLYRMTPGQPESMVKIFDRSGEGRVRVSPDSRWMALISDRSGRADAYVRGLSADDVAERVSDQGAQAVAWSPKTRELFYAQPPEIYVVSYHEDAGRFHVDSRKLFARVEGSDPEQIFEVGNDGRVLIDLPPQKVPPPQLRVVFGLDRQLALKLK